MTDLAALTDPLRFGKLLWPSAGFYREQREIIYSVRDSIETYVPAGNQLGKDYVGGFIAVAFFLCPTLFFDRQYVRSVESARSASNPFPHTRKVVTTSVKAEHMRELWGEIGRFLTTADWKAFGQHLVGKNGLLVLNDKEVRFALEREATEGNVINYLRGQVSEGAEGMSGLHAAYTLVIGDEATGISDMTYSACQGWAKRFLWISNCWDSQGFFRKGVEAGDLVAV